MRFPHPDAARNSEKAPPCSGRRTSGGGAEVPRAPAELDDKDSSKAGDPTSSSEETKPSRTSSVGDGRRAGIVPTALHRAAADSAAELAETANADPWVFGDRFLYSDCEQLTPHADASTLFSPAPRAARHSVQLANRRAVLPRHGVRRRGVAGLTR